MAVNPEAISRGALTMNCWGEKHMQSKDVNTELAKFWKPKKLVLGETLGAVGSAKNQLQEGIPTGKSTARHRSEVLPWSFSVCSHRTHAGTACMSMCHGNGLVQRTEV